MPSHHKKGHLADPCKTKIAEIKLREGGNRLSATAKSNSPFYKCVKDNKTVSCITQKFRKLFEPVICLDVEEPKQLEYWDEFICRLVYEG